VEDDVASDGEVRVPDYPDVEIRISFNPQGDPQVVDDAGLAPWLLYEVLDRVTNVVGEQFEIAPVGAEGDDTSGTE
jgi:hypothetical protein